MTISTKFSIGDEVWFIHGSKAVKQRVHSVVLSGIEQSTDGTSTESKEDFYGVFYKFDYETPYFMTMEPRRIKKREDCCFATREELIASL